MIRPPRPQSPDTYAKIQNPFRRTFVRLLDVLDFVVYALVGLAFIIAASLALGFSALNVLHNFGLAPTFDGFAQHVLDYVSDLLLVLIIMEVLGTVRSYLEKGDTSVKPFLFIGIISATRGILSIGAHLSVAGNLHGDEFNNAMIELLVNGFIVIALGVTIKIMGSSAINKDDDGERRPAEKNDLIERVVVETSVTPHQHEQ